MLWLERSLRTSIGTWDAIAAAEKPCKHRPAIVLLEDLVDVGLSGSMNLLDALAFLLVRCEFELPCIVLAL